MSAVYALLGLTILYFAKRLLARSIGRFVHLLGGSEKTGIIVWSIIFLPGTIVHEIAHFLLAAFTGARTGRIQIFPEFLEDELEEEGSHVTLGYVQTQRLNPIQGFLVGTAPFIFGLPLIVYLSSLMRDNFVAGSYSFMALYAYLFFTVGNSLFPSWTDIKHTIPLIVITLIILAVAFFIFGISPMFTLSTGAGEVLHFLFYALLLSIALDLMIAISLMLLNSLLLR